MRDVTIPLLFGHEEFNRSPNQLGSVIAENCLTVSVHENDATELIGNQGRVGREFENGVIVHRSGVAAQLAGEPSTEGTRDREQSLGQITLVSA
jgi:hypothetical protein